MTAHIDDFDCSEFVKTHEDERGEYHIVEITGYGLQRYGIQAGKFEFDTCAEACTKVAEINEVLKRETRISLRIVWSIAKQGEIIEQLLDW